MEILMIIIGVLAIVSMIAFLVHLFIKAYIQDQQEQDERILQLEKRLEDYRKLDKTIIDATIETINDYHEELEEEIKLIKKQLKKKSDKE